MQQYADFLGKQSPYDRLDASDLNRIAATVEVEFYPAGATIVEADALPLSHLYVVRTGTVTVLDRGMVVDELGPGDTFGHISVYTGLPPALTVVADTECLVYRMPDPREFITHGDRLTFTHYNRLISRARLTARADPGLRSVTDFMREPLWCRSDTPIREAALAMTSTRHSCILLATAAGIGIMTDSDCRREVATGRVSPDAPVAAVASVPAQTIRDTAGAIDAFVEIVTHGVHHLVVVDAADRPLGVVRVFDFASAEIRDPLVIRSEISAAGSLGELGKAASLIRPTLLELHDSGLPSLRIASLLSAIVEAMVERVVALAGADQPGGAESAVLVLGSQARREPMPASDVDTAMVWRAPDSAEDRAAAMLDHAERVVAGLEACGLRRCDEGANASNPLFNRSFERWVGSARHWIEAPNSEGALLLSNMMADSRPISGLPLGKELTEAIGALRPSRDFLKRMLLEALARRPPTGFVRDFVVEADGRHRGQLNLKKGGLSPVAALGRWIAVRERLPAGSTQDRLERGAAAGLLTQDEADTLRSAHRGMFELLLHGEITAIRAGREPSPFVNPRDLDSLTRRHLRESFRAIARLQSRLEGEWLARLG